MAGFDAQFGRLIPPAATVRQLPEGCPVGFTLVSLESAEVFSRERPKFVLRKSGFVQNTEGRTCAHALSRRGRAVPFSAEGLLRGQRGERAC